MVMRTFSFPQQMFLLIDSDKRKIIGIIIKSYSSQKALAIASAFLFLFIFTVLVTIAFDSLFFDTICRMLSYENDKKWKNSQKMSIPTIAIIAKIW